MDKEEFGRRLTESRKEAGLSRDDIVKRASVSLSALAAYERGEKIPPMEIAVKIADVLGVSLDWLAGREVVEKPLQTMKDAINLISILTADYPSVRVQNKPDKFFPESVFTLQFFPTETGNMIEKLLPLKQCDSLTREQYIMLIAESAKRNNYPLDPEKREG